MPKITVTRYHDISAGHRVFGHEGKCRNLHGHNYRIYFTLTTVEGELDAQGRVIDFGVIKEKLCAWLEENWDHKMLLYEYDSIIAVLEDSGEPYVSLSFNPTAENMAAHLLQMAPFLLRGTGTRLVSCTVSETRKCSATITEGEE